MTNEEARINFLKLAWEVLEDEKVSVESFRKIVQEELGKLGLLAFEPSERIVFPDFEAMFGPMKPNVQGDSIKKEYDDPERAVPADEFDVQSTDEAMVLTPEEAKDADSPAKRMRIANARERS